MSDQKATAIHYGELIAFDYSLGYGCIRSKEGQNYPVSERAFAVNQCSITNVMGRSLIFATACVPDDGSQEVVGVQLEVRYSKASFKVIDLEQPLYLSSDNSSRELSKSLHDYIKNIQENSTIKTVTDENYKKVMNKLKTHPRSDDYGVED